MGIDLKNGNATFSTLSPEKTLSLNKSAKKDATELNFATLETKTSN